MNKYIDHEAAINAALLAKSDADITLVPGSFTNGFIEGAKIKGNAILNALADVPAADVVEVKHGHWIEEDGYQICSECGEEHHWIDYRASYCDVCRAKMDGGVNDGKAD